MVSLLDLAEITEEVTFALLFHRFGKKKRANHV
jgi:hypothetical protein